jgi:hypothetical protein
LLFYLFFRSHCVLGNACETQDDEHEERRAVEHVCASGRNVFNSTS